MCEESYQLSIEKFVNQCSRKYYNKKRSNWNYLFGSTTFAGLFPRFWNPLISKKSMIPRPYKDWAKVYIHHCILFDEFIWFEQFVLDLSNLTVSHLKISIKKAKQYEQILLSTELQKVYDKAIFSLNNIPIELRVFDSIFTQLSIVGSFPTEGSGAMSPHVDMHDIVSCVVTIGNLTYGGSTKYYDGHSNNDRGKLLLDVPFQHGRIQIGCYSDIYHEVSKWEGVRYTMNFNLKNQIVDHFETFGRVYFDQYVDAGYPSYEDYLAIV